MGGTYNFVLTFLLDISPLHEQLFKSPGSHDDPMFECSMVQAAYLRGRLSVQWGKQTYYRPAKG